jgi:Phosphate-selective porin O and P
MVFQIALASVVFLGALCVAEAQTTSESSTSSASLQDRIKVVEAELQRLEAEIQSLKRETGSAPQPSEPLGDGFKKQILVPDLGTNERDHEFKGRPEIFIQTRFSRGVLRGADLADTDHNFQLTRIETRWAGRISSRVGAGLELQLHPALDGAADEIVNDAFIEFYPRDGMTFRAGQFVKPFGFDVQQSSSEREYPERAMFEGYFFPGERDRGVVWKWDLNAQNRAFNNTRISAAVLNGNRFFNDFDKRLDTLLRVRRVFPAAGFAIGASAQFGTQRLPPNLTGSNDVRIAGLDLQYAIGRFGARLEVIRGTRPSTLLSREPEFARAFSPGTRTSGGAVSSLFRLTSTDQIFVRYDSLFGDPMTGQNVRAVNAGYLRFLGEHSRVSLNYQWKNRPTFNDDAVNTRFQATLGVVF